MVVPCCKTCLGREPACLGLRPDRIKHSVCGTSLQALPTGPSAADGQAQVMTQLQEKLEEFKASGRD